MAWLCHRVLLYRTAATYSLVLSYRRSRVRRSSKLKSGTATLDELLGEASWLISHAEALADYGRQEEARAELARAAHCEEQVASVLDAARREQEAGVHRISAASCYERIGQYVRAVTLLRAA